MLRSLTNSERNLSDTMEARSETAEGYPLQCPESVTRSFANKAVSRVIQAATGDSIRARSLRGSAWTIAGYGLSQSLRLISNMILTRVLFPEAFGLMALVQVVMQGIGMFSDIGIGPSIVRSNRGDDPDFLNTAWTMQIVRGFFLCGIVCLAAWPASAFFAEPQLLPLLQFASLSSIGLCFTSTKFFTARRHLSVATVTVIEVGTQCITLVVLILLSVLLRSVWALVIGNIIGVVLKSALTQFCLPGPVNRICWDRAAVQELFRFGRWIFLSTAVTFLATQGDRLLLGKFLTLELLGAYTIAASLATIPQAILSAIGQRIVFPGLARVSNDREKMQSAHQRISEPLLMMTGFIIILGLSSGQSLIHLLYDSRYLPAGWMFMPLIIAQWFFVMESLSSTVALVYGKSQWVAISTLTRVAFLYPLGLLAFSSLNSAAAICIMSATIIPQWLLSSFWAKQLGFHLIGAQLKSTLILAAICGSTQILIQYCGIDRSRSGMGILLGIAGIIIWILVHFKVVVSWTNGIQKSENGD